MVVVCAPTALLLVSVFPNFMDVCGLLMVEVPDAFPYWLVLLSINCLRDATDVLVHEVGVLVVLLCVIVTYVMLQDCLCVTNVA